MSFEEKVLAKMEITDGDMQNFAAAVAAKKSGTQEDFEGFCLGLFLGEAGRDDAVAIDPGDATVVAAFEHGVKWNGLVGVVLLKLLLGYLKGLVDSAVIPDWAKALLEVVIKGLGKK